MKIVSSMSVLVSSLVLAGSVFAEEPSRKYSAEQITPLTASQLTLEGDVAWSGIKDWHLSNGKICAVISDVSHESELSPTGGYLTDLGFCGREGESYVNLYYALNLSNSMYPAISRVSSEVTDTSAALISEGEYEGISFKATYRFDEDNGDRLQVKTELTRIAETEASINAFNIVQLSIGDKVFSGSLDGKGPAPGFVHKALPKGLFGDLDGLIASDTLVSLPDAEDGKHMAYGLHIKNAYLRDAEGGEQPITTFIGVVKNYSAVIAFTDPFWFDNDGKTLDALKLVQAQLSDLDLGQTLVIEQEVSVARDRTVASILDGYWKDAPEISGTLGEANVPVFVRRPDGGTINQTYTDEQGQFSLRAPEGDYDLIIKAPGRPVIEQAFSLTQDGAKVSGIDLGGAARLTLPRGAVMRLTFVPLDGQVIDFGRQPLGYLLGGKTPRVVRDVMLVGNDRDVDHVMLSPGRYRVVSSRGPEYSAHDVTLNVLGNQTYTLDISVPELTHPTPGYVHADLHTHSAPSFDNSYPQSQRVKSYLAQGGEVLVATEHENVYDLGKDIAALGLSDQLASVVGTEITGEAVTKAMPYSIGHANAFPMTIKPYEYRNGHPAHEGRRWRDVMADIKQDRPDAVVQLNHARTSLEEETNRFENSAYFSHLIDGQGFDPAIPLDQSPNSSLIEKDPETGVRDIDFDAMELINGTWSNLYSYYTLREDWFALLRQGIRIVGTATSDSHGHTYGEVVLEPRTLIAMTDDSIAGFDETEFLKAIKAGNLYGTNGPLLHIRMDDGTSSAMMGDMITGEQATLHVTASGANWVDIDTLRVFVNGTVVQEVTIQKNKKNLIPLSFDKDSFVTIEVEGPRQGLFADLVNVQVPFAFSNPIYVDADADGNWQAPGLN